MSHIYITPSDLHRAKVGYKLGRPQSRIWDYTYGYAMNYYQPMIDYLDKRDSSDKSEREKLQLPHLPWTNERCAEEYDPKKKIKLYNPEELLRIATKAQKAALKNINNFDVKHSYFSAIPTADATKLLRKLPKQCSFEKVYKKDVEKILKDINDLESEVYFRYKERKFLEDEQKIFPEELKRAIKGKSANQIQNILLCHSKKNMEEEIWIRKAGKINYENIHKITRPQTICKIFK